MTKSITITRDLDGEIIAKIKYSDGRKFTKAISLEMLKSIEEEILQPPGRKNLSGLPLS